MVADGVLTMEWDASYDFDGEVITYHAILARDTDFEEVLLDDTLNVPQASLSDPGEGQYFLSVEATNESGCTQTAFDMCRVNSQKVYGVICFYILADGSVVLDGNGSVRDEGADEVAGTDEAEDANEAEGAVESDEVAAADNAEGTAESDKTKDVDEATTAGSHESAEDAGDATELGDARAAAELGATKAGEER